MHVFFFMFFFFFVSSAGYNKLYKLSFIQRVALGEGVEEAKRA